IEHPERVVLGYGEFAPPPEGPGTGPYAILYWTALHLDTGRTFSSFVRPESFSLDAPSDVHLHHMRLARASIAQGRSLAEFSARWREFVGDRDVLVTWNQSTKQMLETECPGPHNGITLKNVYTNVRNGPCGSLASVLAREGLQSTPAPFEGRPAVVMGQL